MKKFKQNLKLNNKGITLIALVITIVVMLILSIVSIRLVFGEDGIIAKAKYGVNRMKIAQYKEEIEIALAEEEVNAQTGKNLGNKFSYENVWNRLRKNDSSLVVTQQDTQEDIEEYIITYNKFKYKIDKYKKVIYIGDADKEETPVGKYTITYHKNDGTDAIFEQIVDVGKEELLALDKFTRGGYTLEGWYLNAETTGNKVEKATSAIDVYAKWSEVTELINLGRTTIGDITYEESYEIWTKGQLSLFRDKVNDETESKNFEDCILKQMADINLSGENWIPIGYWDGVTGWTGKYFSGTYDGNDKRINITSFTTDNKYKTVSLFGMIIDGNVQKLTTTGSISNINCQECISPMISCQKNGTINNCRNEASVNIEGKYSVGGIVGEAEGTTIENCTNTANIISGFNIGGIVGRLNIGIVKNCTNTGNIKGNSKDAEDNSDVGGIVGWAGCLGNISIENCNNSGKTEGTYFNTGGITGAIWSNEENRNTYTYTIKDSTNTGIINGKAIVGGICGYQLSGSIKNCSSSIGTISSNGRYTVTNIEDAWTGGILGLVESDFEIDNCNNSSNIECATTCVGGILGGSWTNNTVTIKNSYNTGKVKGNSIIGGIVGFQSLGQVKNCYNTNEITATGRDVSFGSAVGGITGWIGYHGTTTIESCNNSGAIKGVDGLGGIVGDVFTQKNNSAYGASITKCYNTGTVTGEGTVVNAIGGICGYANTKGERITISQCYNTNQIKALYYDTNGNSWVGGILGLSEGTTTIENCYNKGYIEGYGDAVGGITGGLYLENGTYSSIVRYCYSISSEKLVDTRYTCVADICGYARNTSFTNCYWLGNKGLDGGHEGSYNNSGCANKTETQFKNNTSKGSESVTYLLNNNNITGVWIVGSGNEGYPQNQ